MTCGLDSNLTLTDWFPSTQKPWEIGWYQRRRSSSLPIAMYFWDGKTWRLGENPWSPPSAFQSSQWRGLAHPPK